MPIGPGWRHLIAGSPGVDSKTTVFQERRKSFMQYIYQNTASVFVYLSFHVGSVQIVVS